MDIEELIAARPADRRDLGTWYSELLDVSEREGISVADLAARLGVVTETIYAWRRKLRSLPRSREVREAAAGLVRVRVVDEQPERGTAHDRPLELRLARGRHLLVPRGFDPAHLVALVNALERC